jgi:F0F1-type ATP synthase membrane subunit b/b'
MEEALRAALRQVTASPMPFLAEVVQFLVLAGVIGWTARRVVGKRLAARRERIASELAEAELAERECVAMGDEARAAISRAEEEAPGIVAAAREQAERERAAGIAQAEAEAEQAIRLARETVEREKAKVAADAAERLVKLTAETARRYLDEFLSEGERRSMTEKAILDSLEEMERGPLPRPRE